MLTSSSFTIFRLGKDAQYTAVGYAFLFASLSGFATFKIARDRSVARRAWEAATRWTPRACAFAPSQVCVAH